MIPGKTWWNAAGARALKTFCQTIVGSGIPVIAISATTDWMSAGWTIGTILLSAALAAIFSLLTSIAGLPEVEKP